MFSGAFTALVTPFRNGEVDVEALESMVEFQIHNGIHGLVPCGTTGETPAMTEEEDRLVISTVVRVAQGRVPVIAGSGSNSTDMAIKYTKMAEIAGADGSLQVAPYYNKPTQEGLYRHFATIADVGLPVILYNVPGRTVADMSNETVLRLAEVPNIVGLKDATADLARCSELVKALNERGAREFAIYSGEDLTALPLMLLGGHGVISVTANVAPRLMSEMCRAALAGELATARALNDRLLPLHRRLFVEPNPIPAKWALAQMGKISNEVRLPLVPLSTQFNDTLRSALREAGCLT